MSPSSACPRCSTVVTYEAGTKPTCTACGYPGPDTRPPEPEESGDQPSWDAPGADDPVHEHAPAEQWSEETPQDRDTSGKAIAALVLGIASFVLNAFGFVTAILAIILGSMARRDVRESGGRLGGAGMAAWGLGLGIAYFAIILVVILVALILGLAIFGAIFGAGA